ncbi:MAG TPA: hypothetical protein VK486_06320, partial [Thermoleophilaceae bacterium]|nr:hypothetical protein [Thermoleophilaceae bacterium]
AVFRSKDPAELGRTLGDYQLRPARHAGEFWLDAGEGDDPVRVKGEYVQEVDPARERLHAGATILDIARARIGMGTTLDDGSASILGDAYEDRHVRADDELLAYLTDEEVIEEAPAASGQQAGRDIAKEMIAAAYVAAGLPVPDDGASGPVASVATLAPTRPQRIVEIVREHGPVEFSEIVNRLRECGDAVSNVQSVTNALTKLVKDCELMRVDGGYKAA